MTHPQYPTAALLPCPFCGGAALLTERAHYSLVNCGSAHCNMDSGCKAQKTEDAIAAWNTRAHPNPPAPGADQSQVEALRSALSRLSKVRWASSRSNVMIPETEDFAGKVLPIAGLSKEYARSLAAYIAAANPAVIAELLAQLDAHPHPTGWRDIASAPKHTEVLVWRDDAGVFIAKLTTPDAVITAEEMERENLDFPDDFEEWWADAYGWQEGSEKPTHWMPIPAEPNAAHPAKQQECQTCGGHGMIGGPSFHAPDEGGVPCPDCNAEQQEGDAAGEKDAGEPWAWTTPDDREPISNSLKKEQPTYRKKYTVPLFKAAQLNRFAWRDIPVAEQYEYALARLGLKDSDELRVIFWDARDALEWDAATDRYITPDPKGERNGA